MPYDPTKMPPDLVVRHGVPGARSPDGIVPVDAIIRGFGAGDESQKRQAMDRMQQQMVDAGQDPAYAERITRQCARDHNPRRKR